MAQATKSQTMILPFSHPQGKIKPSDLICFSDLYEEELKKIIKYLKANEGRYTSLFFTRILTNGKMKEAREFLGYPKNVSDNSFEFYSAYNISSEAYWDDSVKNEIVFNNILGVLPTLGIISLEEILEINHTRLAQKYLNFWEKAKKELSLSLTKKHHVEIYLSNNMVIEGEVLEINKSNLLIFSKKERENQVQNGYYVYTNIIPHERFLYFISSDYFIEKVKIIPSKVNINPYDDEY